MTGMFERLDSKVEFAKQEEELLEFWEREHVFKRSLAARRSGPEFVFYDGPPFATGLPHYGHLLASTIKDIVPRYQTMRGFYVERRFGWDCHGLPIEALAQDSLQLASSSDIADYGIDRFNETCRSMVLTYVQDWQRTVTRLGRWVDFEHDYKTMDLEFMETIWWVFKRLWEQGRVYKSHRIMPYSWKLNTPLSNFEAGSNYQEVEDPAITVRAKLVCGFEEVYNKPVYVLIWTTTPWTLPGNLAICAGSNIEYVLVEDVATGEGYVLAESRVGAYYRQAEEYRIMQRFRGDRLAGLCYEPLFSYFAGHANSFRILTDDFVSTEDGTGLVHLAPAYGEEDYRVCSAAGIEFVDPLDADCKFTHAVPDYAGRFCKDVDSEIIKRLKQSGQLVHRRTIRHSYPFCDRTDTPLIYRAIDAWYVRVEDLRERLVANNDRIHWMPGYVGQKRFGNWLRQAKDWNISRNRFWGSCIPLWISEDGEDIICIGSIAELEALSGVHVEDLHKHTLDGIVIERDGKTYRRTPEVLDCWFESGSMPYAQAHYPFADKEHFERNFPADFIAEGLDQTRGWFYTLMVLSTALFDQPAFKHVVVNGLVLAEDGRKMSKRLKNYPDPTYLIDTYGADALRLYMIYSPVVRAEDLCFSEDGVKHLLRHIMIPLWNAVSFFITYANIDGWEPDGTVPGSRNVLDRWIQSSLESLVDQVQAAMDVYDLQRSVRPFIHFIEDLTNWYIRRSRRRFWKSQDDQDKADAYATLHYVLLQLSQVAAPFIPFISEAIYRRLRCGRGPESVHLCDFPAADGAHRDRKLEEAMRKVMAVVRLGRQLRAEHDLKVRQPLATLHIVCPDAATLSLLREHSGMIEDELNVKQLSYATKDSGLAHLRAKPDFRRLGPRFGAKMKAVAAAVARLTQVQLEALVDGHTMSLDLDGESVSVCAEDLVLDRIPLAGLVVAAEGDVLVGLDTELNETLIQEGLAREMVNKIQAMRKQAELSVTDRIRVQVVCGTEVAQAMEAFGSYIQGEILAEVLQRVEQVAADSAEWELNGHQVKIAIAGLV